MRRIGLAGEENGAWLQPGWPGEWEDGLGADL